MKTKIKIESAYPQVRMLERPNSFAYEVWAWKVHYLIVPTDKGCRNCSIVAGEVMLPLTGLSYPRAVLAKEVRRELGVE